MEKNTLVYGTAVGICEHLVSLAPRTILDYKQFIHHPMQASSMLMSNVYTQGLSRYYKGACASLSGVALGHIGLFSCLRASEKENNKWKIATYGMIGKVIHDVCMLPGDCVRMRANLKDCGVMEACKSIYLRGGMKGYFGGLLPSLLMNVPSGAVEFLTMHALKEENAFFAGGIAGVLGAVIVSPLDTVRTFRMMDGRRSIRQICGCILEERGVSGFFRGMPLRVISAGLSYGTFTWLCKAWDLEIKE